MRGHRLLRRFANLEEIAQDPAMITDLAALTRLSIDAPLLTAQ
jgi:hypothetical protein